MLDIEQAIREVGTVYQALTGRPIEAGRSDLPPEADAHAHIEGRYHQFKSIVGSPLGAPATVGAGPGEPTWAPQLSVLERDGEVRYEIDVPGVSRGEVGVSVLGAFLVVRGMRDVRTGAPERHEPGQGGPRAAGEGRSLVRYSERASGPFQRVIALPAGARRDGIQAALHDGVLAVTVPTDGPAGAAVSVEIR